MHPRRANQAALRLIRMEEPPKAVPITHGLESRPDVLALGSIQGGKARSIASAAVAERVGIRGLLADRGVRYVIGLALLVMTGFGLVLPILPLFGRSFGVDYGTAS